MGGSRCKAPWCLLVSHWVAVGTQWHIRNSFLNGVCFSLAGDVRAWAQRARAENAHGLPVHQAQGLELGSVHAHSLLTHRVGEKSTFSNAGCMLLPQSKDAHPELCLILSVWHAQAQWYVLYYSGHVLVGRREWDLYNLVALTGPESFSSSFPPSTCSANHSNQSPCHPLLIRSNSQEVIHLWTHTRFCAMSRCWGPLWTLLWKKEVVIPGKTANMNVGLELLLGYQTHSCLEMTRGCLVSPRIRIAAVAGVGTWWSPLHLPPPQPSQGLWGAAGCIRQGCRGPLHCPL